MIGRTIRTNPKKKIPPPNQKNGKWRRKKNCCRCCGCNCNCCFDFLRHPQVRRRGWSTHRTRSAIGEIATATVGTNQSQFMQKVRRFCTDCILFFLQRNAPISFNNATKACLDFAAHLLSMMRPRWGTKKTLQGRPKAA